MAKLVADGTIVEINDAGGGDVDLVFTSSGMYSANTLTWAEALIVAALLTKQANDSKHRALHGEACDAYNRQDASVKEVLNETGYLGE